MPADESAGLNPCAEREKPFGLRMTSPEGFALSARSFQLRAGFFC